MKRINSLDSARGLAAFSIVIGHFIEELSKKDHGGSVFYVSSFVGSLSVGLFFLISGFIIPASIGRSALSAYVVKRALRIYPVIIACSLIKFFILIEDGYLQINENSLKTLAYSFTLFSNTLIWNDQNIEPIFWTVMIEVKFYMIALLIHVVSRRSVVSEYSALLILLFVIITCDRMMPVPTRPWISDIDVLLSTVPMLLLGWFVFLLDSEAIAKSEFITGAFGCLVALVLSPYPIYFSWTKGAPSWLLSLVTFMILIYLKNHGVLLESRMARYLGSISFPLYAVHPAFMMALERHNTGSVWLNMPVYVASCLAAASLIHAVVEAPAIRLSRNLTRPRPC